MTYYKSLKKWGIFQTSSCETCLKRGIFQFPSLPPPSLYFTSSRLVHDVDLSNRLVLSFKAHFKDLVMCFNVTYDSTASTNNYIPAAAMSGENSWET